MQPAINNSTPGKPPRTRPSKLTPLFQQFLTLGINATTKALENSRLAVVLVSTRDSDPVLTSHLPTLAQVRQVPLCAIEEVSALLGQIFSLKTCLALGLLKSELRPATAVCPAEAEAAAAEELAGGEVVEEQLERPLLGGRVLLVATEEGKVGVEARRGGEEVAEGAGEGPGALLAGLDELQEGLQHDAAHGLRGAEGEGAGMAEGRPQGRVAAVGQHGEEQHGPWQRVAWAQLVQVQGDGGVGRDLSAVLVQRDVLEGRHHRRVAEQLKQGSVNNGKLGHREDGNLQDKKAKSRMRRRRHEKEMVFMNIQ